jgi:hypothetical protein
MAEKSDKDKINITTESLEKILNKAVDQINEDRALALDRYRVQDQQIQTGQDFILQGKNAVDYLKTASDQTKELINVAKMLKDILYSSEDKKGNGGGGGMSDEMKKELLQMMKKDEL